MRAVDHPKSIATDFLIALAHRLPRPSHLRTKVWEAWMIVFFIIGSSIGQSADVPGLPQQQPVLRLREGEAPVGTPHNPFLRESYGTPSNESFGLVEMLKEQGDNPIPAWFMRFLELLISWDRLSPTEQRSINVAHLHGKNVWLQVTADGTESAERKICVYQISYYAKIASSPDASKKPEFLLIVPESTPASIKALPVKERNQRVAVQYAQYFTDRLDALEKTAGIASGQTLLVVQRVFGDLVDFKMEVGRPPPEVAQIPSTPLPQPNQDLPKGTGTGFFITNEGYLVTNQHVIEGASRVAVVTPTGSYDAQVVRQDIQNDLAVLKIQTKSVGLPLISSRGVKLGDTVATVGFPNTTLQGFSPKLGKGEIASLSGSGDDARYFQISVPVQPGNSGGALVDEQGNVVGVVSAKLSAGAALATSGALPENVNYAVKSSYLLGLLESVPELVGELEELSVKNQSFSEMIQSVEKAAALVVVY
jgi:S1-C subfamily serine protease